jgi:F5/8 type C domain
VRPRPAPTEGGICASFNAPAGKDTYCVSSVLRQDAVNSYNYGPESLFDGKDSTAWVEGVDGQGIGEWIVVEFDTPRLVRGIEIANGYNKDRDLFFKNSRVKELKVEFSDRQRKTVALQDTGVPQRVALPREQPVKASWVKFTIESVYPGTKFDDTAVSELHIASEPLPP